MQIDSEKSTYVSMRTQQMQDTFDRTGIQEVLSARLLSVRCQEAQTQALNNQDYAQLQIAPDGSSLCFCVCDGVGSSYRGDFAARYLAPLLIQWLQDLPTLQEHPQAIATRLGAHLDSCASMAQEQLQQLSIASDTPMLVREVLEEQREAYGSEVVFLGGRVDIGSWSSDLQFSRPMQGLFCWMGNVKGRLFISPEHTIPLGDLDDQRGRWSTLQGVRGVLTTWSVGLSTVERLLVYTDGLDAIASSLHDLDDAAWQEHAQMLLRLPANDDMTALEMRWGEG